MYPRSKCEQLTLPVVLAMDRMQLKKLRDNGEAEQTLLPEDVPIINGEVKSLAYDGMEFGHFSIITSILHLIEHENKKTTEKDDVV